MKFEALIVTRRSDETLLVEPAFFTKRGRERVLPFHLAKVLSHLSYNWKHKSELYPPGNPELAIKYLWKLERVLRDITESDGKGYYRLADWVSVCWKQGSEPGRKNN